MNSRIREDIEKLREPIITLTQLITPEWEPDNKEAEIHSFPMGRRRRHAP